MKSLTKTNSKLNFVIFFRKKFITISILVFFLISYLTLSLNKHFNYLSGYDLSIIDQAIWKYSKFINPITTTHVYYDAPIYTDHLEIILIFIAPFYWLIDNSSILIVIQVLSVISSGLAVFLLAKKHGLKDFVANCLLFSYLLFFGIQFALWSDVHSLVIAIGFIAWFIYFLDLGKVKSSILLLLLALICKEDIGFLTSLVSFVYFLKYRNRLSVFTFLISVFYILFVFLVYFPILMGGYKYADPKGLFHDIQFSYFFNTEEKRTAIFYSLASFGFIPILAPIFLLPFIGDLGHYFVLGNTIVTSSHGIFAHYRSTVGLFLILPSIFFIAKMRKFSNKAVGVYLIFWTLFFQYYLHLPLSYLAKQWFWNGSPEKNNISEIIKKIPRNASIATTVNIAPHITHREYIYTLVPYTRDFEFNSPCGLKNCRWFRVGGNPELLLIDVGKSWNILHYLVQRDEFLDAIGNLEKNGNVKLIESNNTTRLYKIIKKI